MTNQSTIPTPASPDVCTAAILIDGTEISGEFHVLSIYVSRELNRIPSATILLQDGEAAKSTFAASNTEHFIPGKAIEIQLGYRAQNETVFKGIIVKHSIKIRKNGSQLSIDCRDEAMKMTIGAKSRYYLDKKDSDIMEEVIDAYGLQKDVSATQVELKQVVQYDASDWDFLLCRAEANGMVIKVEDGKIGIAPPATSAASVLSVQYGASLLELDAEIDARWQSPGISAQSWNAADQEVLSTDASEPATTDNGNLSPGALAEVVGGDPHALVHGGKLSQPELQAWADGRLLKERLAKVRGRAKFTGFAGVMPDKVIEITGIGERFEGKLYVSGVRHGFAKGNWETDVQLGLNPEICAETFNLRPLPAAGLLPAISGLQIGIVTVLENDPDGEDRIKLRVPTISMSEEGIWARIATLDAGKERGTFFRPEIGDEVVVGFLDDDPRHPVVLGMCHSSAKPSPEPAKDDNHRKGYVSREKMKFTFDDEKKVITLETPGGNKILLSEEDKGIRFEDQNGNKITLDDNGIVIESSKDLILKASQDIKQEGMNMELKAQTALKATGTSSAEVSGASTSIKGSATTVIQGGLVQIN
ncbi:type VI secretion system tip protein VgrG [Methylobacter sp. YRD-M1]|uniref:type VI secretion system tip protein VgrG n=1 Tax=Methylobacter sp. YRD-M1 TaxID=2911520 RepID=UPI00227ADD1E|nr:type VI secretion system tip protein VgrG [Methylobacter sp. YRD-M1]WAK03983.1 type VI secretion system tip protein VgrG [Methylobacter sp. YRD-M1]